MKLVFGGDVMLGRWVDSHVLGRSRSPLGPIRPWLVAADLVLVNLECAITGRDTWYPGPQKAFYFRARPAAAAMLAEAGVHLVQLANNHALDAGEPGLEDTVALLEAQGIGHAGAGQNLAQARQAVVRTCAGERVALLAWCDHQPDFAATATRPGIRFLDVADLHATSVALAADVRALQAEVRVVGCHWQHNWEPEVRPEYRRLAETCVDAGATVVWGHGPHHVQGVAWHGDGVVLYSTGDLVDDYAVDPDYRNDLGLLFTVEVQAGRAVRVEARPTVIRAGVVHPAEGAERAWVVRRFVQACAALGTAVVEVGDVMVVRR